MVAPRLRRFAPICLCLATLATGCVATPEPSGSFTNGGSGLYGQTAKSATPPVETKSSSGFFSSKKPAVKATPQLYLAHAQVEESRGNAAGARKAFDEQKSSYAAARKSYQQVLATDEKSVDAIIGLARLDQASGRINDAEQGFTKAVRIDSGSPRSLDAMGQFYADQGRWSEAIPTFEKALAASPDDKVVRFHFGVALARSGQVDKARPQLVEAVGPDVAHYNLGVILHERGDLAASEEQFVAAIVENPRLEQAQQWLKEVRREQQEKSRPTQAAAAVSPLSRHQAAHSDLRRESMGAQR